MTYHKFSCSDDSKLKAAARMSLLRKSLKKAKQKEQTDNSVSNESNANLSLESGKDLFFLLFLLHKGNLAWVFA